MGGGTIGRTPQGSDPVASAIQPGLISDHTLFHRKSRRFSGPLGHLFSVAAIFFLKEFSIFDQIAFIKPTMAMTVRVPTAGFRSGPDPGPTLHRFFCWLPMRLTLAERLRDARQQRLALAERSHDAFPQRLALVERFRDASPQRLPLAERFRDASPHRLPFAERFRDARQQRLSLAGRFRDASPHRLAPAERFRAWPLHPLPTRP